MCSFLPAPALIAENFALRTSWCGMETAPP